MYQWSDERSRGLLDAAPDAMLVVDADGRIVLANLQAEQLFGYHRSELLGEPIELLVPEAHRQVHPMHRAGYVAEPRARPMGHGIELSARRRDGSEFPAEVSLSAISTDDGLLVAVAVRDVTERRRDAEAQARLASIVQSSHDAIIGKTPDGYITSWNPAAERLYGYGAADVIGQHSNIFIPPERRFEEEHLLKKVAHGERVDQYRTQRLRKDGTPVTISLALSPIARGGEIIGVASISRDIGERERAEAKFLGLLEAAPDALVGVNRDGRIMFVNAQTERLFGYARDELIGQLVEVLVPEASRSGHAGYRNRYLDDPRARPMGAGRQLRARRRDGTEFPADISLSSLRTEDGLLIAAGIRDVTDRIEAEAEQDRLKAIAERERVQRRLHQAQRLESLGQLAGGVAHDFNNLLGVIVNYAAFVVEEIEKGECGPGGRGACVIQDVQQIQRAAERGVALTRQLLAFGRREVIRPRVLSLNTVVVEVNQLLRRSIGEQFQLSTVLADDLWPVKADPGQVEQVLVNLAVNARDAMPTGGSLSIETENVTLDGPTLALSPGRYARLRIRDTGSGIPEDVLPRIFEPFFTTKPKGEGTGLGLATVYGIVVQAGGDISVTSEPGVGTTFDVLLPATEEAFSEEHPTLAVPRRGGGETVLVVEDEPAIREVTRRILDRNGYRVVIAETGASAVRMVGEGLDIDLLLTDVVMPQLLGKEVAERVLALRPTVKVLYMSGYARPELAAAGTLEPGLTLLQKPFTEADLLTEVRRVLDTDVGPPATAGPYGRALRAGGGGG